MPLLSLLKDITVMPDGTFYTQVLLIGKRVWGKKRTFQSEFFPPLKIKAQIQGWLSDKFLKKQKKHRLMIL